MDAFEVAILRQQAQQKADCKAEEQRKEKERREQVKTIGRERLKDLIPAKYKPLLSPVSGKIILTLIRTIIPHRLCAV